MKNPIFLLLTIGFASCATPPKALIVSETPVRPPQQKAAVPQPIAQDAADDVLRMPDMLTLPDEEKLRSAAPRESRDSTVITRPPEE